VSCLHPIFDQDITPQHEYGVLMGKKSAQNKERQELLRDIPSSHNATDLNEMIEFIGSCATLVTDSYHAMYWGLLMGRKVLVIPTTTKFIDFKYPVPITQFSSFKEDIKKAVNVDGLLEECRTINQDFAKKVFDYLSIDSMSPS
jgi:exopolysaccharide biosynthesis predicted pyruvyltransferase EpsI